MRHTALWVLFGMIVLKGSAGAQQPPAPGGKMTATAIAVLTQPFCTVTVNKRTLFRFAGTMEKNEFFELGRLLCPAVEEAVRKSFERVIRMETAPKPEDAGGHLVLIPRYIDMEATSGPHIRTPSEKGTWRFLWSGPPPIQAARSCGFRPWKGTRGRPPASITGSSWRRP
jgi:hypothetical protein